MSIRSDLLTDAISIAESYQKAGQSLTLRQLYYQLVAGAVIPNSDKSYKQLGDVIGNARLEGQFDMDLLVDRGRHAGASKHHDAKMNVEDALQESERHLRALPFWNIRVDRWFGQPIYTSVWVEKDALSGVFEGPCEDLGVGLFACKGYPSHSSLWQWLVKLEEAYATSNQPVIDDEGNELEVIPIDEAVVLYFGDHDPDGWQIPRSAEETLNTLARVNGLEIPPIRFERVALLMNQIQKYNPPPFPAKQSSSRYANYFAEHGIDEAWELDALKPSVLDNLIRQNVEGLFDPAIHAEWQRFAEMNRHLLRQKMLEPDWVQNALK